jgi:hypothetical protein
MPRAPKRLPGEPNSKADTPAASSDWMAGGRGNDYGIARGVFALRDWRKRRKAIKARRS